MSSRRRVLESALAVFAEHGADGGSMREIARRAGVNVATAYHHFGSKRDLLMAIFEEIGFLGGNQDPSWATEEMDPRLVLERLCLGAWVLMSSGADVLRLAIAEAVKGDGDVRAAFGAWRLEGDGYIEDVLRRAGLGGEDVARRAWVVRSVIWGTFVSELMEGRFDAEELHRAAERVAATLLEPAWR